MNSGSPEQVEVLSQDDTSRIWKPIASDETFRLLTALKHLNQESKDRLLNESIGILSQGRNPHIEQSNQVGLIIGYVQSGKTLSFTTVSALARDNKFRLVIVITGISNYLFDQSVQRLERDLEIRTRHDRIWLPVSNPKLPDANTIEDALTDWKDGSVPDHFKPTVLITVMKNHQHLANLLEVLSSVDLAEVPALVIDDEADQAGMNTLVNDGEESTIYRRLLTLRTLLPNHTYLQYTATPQAPLLINIIDSLSPNFADVLSPGDDYVGGKSFFTVNQRELVREIPPNDLPGRAQRLVEPPESLLNALRVFYLGVAAGFIEHGGQKGWRSMMVHPSQSTSLHATYYRWVVDVTTEWRRILELPTTEQDRIDLLQEFETGYDDLSRTVNGLPSKATLFSKLPQSLRRTKIHLVNSTPAAVDTIEWHTAYSFILVGGQAMDRGFTVEGLAVSYMPRNPGVGNADTVQQRARFFGYKRPYLGYCRVFLEGQTLDAFTAYVEHEEDIRSQLIANRRKSLDEWKRAFFLDGALNPTRANVLELPFIRGDFSRSWYWTKSPHESPRAIKDNQNVIDAFKSRLEISADPTYRLHDYAEVPLADTYANLLTHLRTPAYRDTQQFTGLLLQIKAYLDENPNALCDVYFMHPGKTRERGVRSGELKSVHQGAYTLANGVQYPGDSELRSQSKVVVQIYNLDIKLGAQGVISNVPTVAVRLPTIMSAAWLSQQMGSGNG